MRYTYPSAQRTATRHPQVLRRVTLGLLALICAGWGSGAEQPDGDAAFVIQATPMVLGRPVRNEAELIGLRTVLETAGEEAMLGVLYAQDEFAEHWSLLFADMLQVARTGRHTQNAECYETYGLPNTKKREDLTDWVAEKAPDQSFNAGRFTMRDLLEGAIESDAIDAISRVYLFPQAAFPHTLTQGPGAEKILALRNFLGVYANRDEGCMGCHATTYSVTDDFSEADDWDRHFPVPYDLEASLFDATVVSSRVYGGLPYEDLLKRARNLFRTDIFWEVGDPGDPGDTGQFPWGMATTCLENIQPSDGGEGYRGLVTLSADNMSTTNSNQQFAGLGRTKTMSIVDLAITLGAGIDSLSSSPTTTSRFSGTADLVNGESIVDGTCGGCHDVDPASTGAPVTSGAPRFVHLLPGLSDGRIVAALHDSPEAMGLNWELTAVEIDDSRDVIAYLRDQSAFEYLAPDVPSLAEAGEGLALATAINIVDQTFAEVMGSRLTLPHGQPRTQAASDMLLALSWAFVDNGWSLRTVLTELLTSAAFNHVPPSESTDAYPYLMLVDPWAATTAVGTTEAAATADPSTADDSNGPGDVVHRRSIPALFGGLHGALNWPPPRIYNNDSGVVTTSDTHPTEDAMQTMGRFASTDASAFNELNFQALWEWEQHIACEKQPINPNAPFEKASTWDEVTLDSDGAVAPEHWVDWIDRLVEAAEHHDLDALSGALRARILGDATIDPNESALLATYWGAPMSTLWQHYVGDGEAKLRGYCAVLLESPQYMLAGLADVPDEPQGPALTVCGPDEPCTVEAWCSENDLVLDALGEVARCSGAMDLEVELVLMGPPSHVSGPTYAVPYRAVVRSIGAASVTPSSLDVSINSGTTTIPLPTLHSGEDFIHDFTVNIKLAGPSGPPTVPVAIRVEADPGYTFEDADRSDNVALLTLKPSTWKADYRLEDLAVTHVSASVARFTYTVINRGPAQPIGMTGVAVHAGSMTPFQTDPVPPLAPFASLVFTADVPVPCDVFLFYSVTVDPANHIVELDETNNSVAAGVGRFCYDFPLYVDLLGQLELANPPKYIPPMIWWVLDEYLWGAAWYQPPIIWQIQQIVGEWQIYAEASPFLPNDFNASFRHQWWFTPEFAARVSYPPLAEGYGQD